MKIVLLLNNDIASNFALNLLLPIVRQHQVSVFLSSKVGGNDTKPLLLQKLAQFEQHDVFDYLKGKKEFKNYQQISQNYGIAIEILNDINSSQGSKKIKACQADIIISIRYGVILKDAVIKLAKFGVINLHSGNLPQYRGVMATFWALNNGDKTLTATLHTIEDSTIDTGKIIAKSTINVQEDKSYLWHVLQLYIGGCELIKQALTRLEENAVLALSSVDEKQPSNYYSFPTEAQLSTFIEQHGALFCKEQVFEFIN